MEVKVSIAQTNKYAVSHCGDSVDVVERPQGGVSLVLADGQGSGKSAKTTSSVVVNKAITLIADGTRDGAVARSAHDYLYVLKDGKVSSTLTLISADFATDTVVISRNSNCPVIMKDEFGITFYDESVNSIVDFPVKMNRYIGNYQQVFFQIDELCFRLSIFSGHKHTTGNGKRAIQPRA